MAAAVQGRVTRSVARHAQENATLQARQEELKYASLGLRLKNLMQSVLKGEHNELSTYKTDHISSSRFITADPSSVRILSDEQFKEYIHGISAPKQAATPNQATATTTATTTATAQSQISQSSCRKVYTVAKKIFKAVLFTGAVVAGSAIGVYAYQNWDQQDMRNYARVSGELFQDVVRLLNATTPVLCGSWEMVSNFAQRAFSLMW